MDYREGYEGGSTLFGRWQLPALMQTVAGLAEAMRDGRPVTPAPGPRPHQPRSWLRTSPADTGSFGAIVAEPDATYRPGESVEAVFVSAIPNNDLHRNRTYLEVVHLDGTDWVRIADDGDWSTTFRWRREGAKRLASHHSLGHSQRRRAGSLPHCPSRDGPRHPRQARAVRVRQPSVHGALTGTSGSNTATHRDHKSCSNEPFGGEDALGSTSIAFGSDISMIRTVKGERCRL